MCLNWTWFCGHGCCLRPLDDLPHCAAGVVALAPFAWLLLNITLGGFLYLWMPSRNSRSGVPWILYGVHFQWFLAGIIQDWWMRYHTYGAFLEMFPSTDAGTWEWLLPLGIMVITSHSRMEKGDMTNDRSWPVVNQGEPTWHEQALDVFRSKFTVVSWTPHKCPSSSDLYAIYHSHFWNPMTFPPMAQMVEGTEKPLTQGRKQRSILSC